MHGRGVDGPYLLGAFAVKYELLKDERAKLSVRLSNAKHRKHVAEDGHE